MTIIRKKGCASHWIELPTSLVCTLLASAVALGIAAMPGLLAQGLDSISVDENRPLAAAVKIMEDRYGWLVTYEDPPYEHPDELADVTEQVRRDGQFSKRVLVPKGGAFSHEFATPPPQATGEQIHGALIALLDAYHASGIAGRFRVVRTRDVFHVLPAGVRLKSGEEANRSSILDVHVTLPPKKGRSVYEAVDEIIAQVGRLNDQHIFIARVPTNWFRQMLWEEGSDAERARDLLIRVFESTKLGLSWRLLYDPGLRWYGLNVRIVRQPVL